MSGYDPPLCSASILRRERRDQSVGNRGRAIKSKPAGEAERLSRQACVTLFDASDAV